MIDSVQDPVVIVPIRDFDGMTRLSTVLSPRFRAELAQRLANNVISAAMTCQLKILIVTSSDDVKQWATGLGIDICEDPGDGLSSAAAAGVSRVDGAPWMVIHADLPLITPSALRSSVQACAHNTLLVPSQDGGTTIVGGRGGFPFSYGTGSFHRHLASAPNATVISSAALSVDIDTPRHLRSFPEWKDWS